MRTVSSSFAVPRAARLCVRDGVYGAGRTIRGSLTVGRCGTGITVERGDAETARAGAGAGAGCVVATAAPRAGVLRATASFFCRTDITCGATSLLSAHASL